jgi:hypothetical protein
MVLRVDAELPVFAADLPRPAAPFWMSVSHCSN